jgi:hypothetical protein
VKRLIKPFNDPIRHGIFTKMSMAENYLATPDSSTTLFLKYYQENEGLEIGFQTREVYQYLKVPLDLWKNYYTEVLAGGSSGKFFNQHIKDKYEFIKIT